MEGVAKEAHDLFLSEDYNGALEKLCNIKSRKQWENNRILRHNEVLTQLKLGANVRETEAAIFSLYQEHLKESNKEDFVEENSKLLACYNLSLIHFYARDYKRALPVLEHIVDTFSSKLISVDPRVVLLSCSLLIDTYIQIFGEYQENELLIPCLNGSYEEIKKTAEESRSAPEGGAMDLEAIKKRTEEESFYDDVYLLSRYKIALSMGMELKKALNDIVENKELSNKGNSYFFQNIMNRLAVLEGRYEEGIKALLSLQDQYAGEKSDRGYLTSIHSNFNLASIYFAMRKYELALYLFRKCVEEAKWLKKRHSGNPVVLNSVNDTMRIITGKISYLFLRSQKPEFALQSLFEYQYKHSQNVPMIWLRVAEALLQQSIMESRRSRTSIAEARILGEGRKKFILLVNSVFGTEGEIASESSVGKGTGNALALKCVKNAYFLVRNGNNRGSSDRRTRLLIHILITLMYASLCIGDALQVLRYSELLQQTVSDLPDLYKYLHVTYKAEALLLLGRTKEAIHALKELLVMMERDPRSPQQNKVKNLGIDSKENPSLEYPPEPSAFDILSSEIQCHLLLNLSCAYIVDNDPTNAQLFLSKGMRVAPTSSYQMFVTSIYLQLLNGNFDGALKILRPTWGSYSGK